MKCEGPACSAVEIVWDGLLSGYRVANRDFRGVVVTLASSSGDIVLQLPPQSETVIHVTEFDLPFQAFFF
jgi:hypothetical protein